MPKKTGAVEIKHFRPNSLVGGVYKIISKVLTYRMKRCWRILFPNLILRLLGGDKF